MHAMQEKFDGRADFLTIYIKEAHPEDEWQVDSNEDEGFCFKQPTTLPERIRIARAFVDEFDFELPLAVDSMDNAAEEAYAGWPERLYVVDATGKIAYKGGTGPMNFDPDELEAFLDAHVEASPLADPEPEEVAANS